MLGKNAGMSYSPWGCKESDTTEQQQFMSDAWKCLTILVEFIYNLHEMTSEKIMGFLNHQSLVALEQVSLSHHCWHFGLIKCTVLNLVDCLAASLASTD